jgi:predicted transcriptional regulator of viral defense system
MNFRELEAKVRPLLAFNLNDVRKIDPDFHRQQLSYWLKKGFITPLVGGYYRLAYQEVNQTYLLMLANRNYEPSYISLESALAYYQVIPESVLGITSVSSRKTKQYDSAWGRFNYRSIKPLFMFGYNLVVGPGGILKFKIASLEKAVLDYLYLNSGMNALEDFYGLRWSRHQLQHLDNKSLYTYLKIFGNTALDSRVSVLMAYAHA